MGGLKNGPFRLIYNQMVAQQCTHITHQLGLKRGLHSDMGEVSEDVQLTERAKGKIGQFSSESRN